MNVVYRCIWTEYERGWGQRPDGVTYAMTEVQFEQEIKRIEDLGDYECFSRSSNRGLCIITDELAKKIHDHHGIYTTTSEEDLGMLGAFIPKKPKANIETFRQQTSTAAP